MKARPKRFIEISDAFEKCPSCLSTDSIREIGMEAYCSVCGWDSSTVFVDTGGMDELIFQFEQHIAERSTQHSSEDMESTQSFPLAS